MGGQRAKVIWMPFYVGDYLADTGHLSTEEHGAYLLLIFHYWQQKFLPEDEGQLARIAKVSPHKWRQIKIVLQPFFERGWRHKRIESELKKTQEKHERLSRAGRKGGRVKTSSEAQSFGVIKGGVNE